MPPTCRDRVPSRAMFAVSLVFTVVLSSLAFSGTVTPGHSQPRSKPHRSARSAGAKPAAANAATATPSQPTASGAVVPGRAGMIEGELPPPTTGQREALPARDAALDRSAAGLTIVTRADGSQYVNLQGRFRAYSVLTLAPDGSARISCVEGAAKALEVARAGNLRSDAPARRRAPVGPQEE